MVDVIEFGDCRDIMRNWIELGVKVHTCVTSPPYFGLRDYNCDGQIGLEKTPDEYIATLVDVFRHVRELLVDDGTLWVNIGDTYAAQRGGSSMPAQTVAGGISGRGDSLNETRRQAANQAKKCLTAETKRVKLAALNKPIPAPHGGHH